MLQQVLRWILLGPWRWWNYRWECFREEERKQKDKEILIEQLRHRTKRFK